MNIGILTYHFANNYGAALQAYSLQKILEGMGANTELIDYRSAHQNSNNSLILDNNSLKNIGKNLIRIPHYKNRKARIAKFAEFRRQYLNISPVRISNKQDVRDYIDGRFDAVIVGSDQVWNPAAPDYDDIYYKISRLARVPVMAYACSLGNACPDNLRPYRNDILSFHAVSVREAPSIQLLKDVDPLIRAECVLDPTLVVPFDNLDAVSQYEDSSEKYMLCYFLGRRHSVAFRRAAYRLGEELRLRVIFINANYGLVSYGGDVRCDCGPSEFLGLIKHASVICTNSFHGCVLSLRFSRPFFCFEEMDTADTRKIDLLKRTGLVSRIVYDYDVSGMGDYSLDFADAKKKLRALREKSMEYLRNGMTEKKG